MSDLPSVKPDVFISYSHIDNVSSTGVSGRGWVSTLHLALQVRLRQLLGVSNLQIFRESKLDGNDVFDEALLDVLDSAALLVCVVSPRYLKSEWCRRELQEFIKHRGRADSIARIFKVLLGPIRADLQLPSEVNQKPGYKFFESDLQTGITRTFDEVNGPEARAEFWMRLDDLAYDIATALELLRQKNADKKVDSPATHQVNAFKIVEPDGKSRALRVFLCHSSEDKPKVRNLYRFLVGSGVDAWLDEEKLIPGQLWESEIRKALKKSDAVVVCLSSTSVTKTGYLQKEIKQVIDIADEHPDEAIFLIPARFEDCLLPERFAKIHWVNLFEESGNRLLIRALELRASQLIVEAS